MNLFISWSGDHSRRVAETLRSWIPLVLQSVRPWMSKVDIPPGGSWSRHLSETLDETDCGILCLTHDNLHEPWIQFEAGALSKSVAHSLVVPYLIGLSVDSLPLPLAQFQAVSADRNGTLSMVKTLASATGSKLDGSQIQCLFGRLWPDLNKVLDCQAGDSNSVPTFPPAIC